MADNVDINAATEATTFKAATDEIATAHYQRIKLTLGADGVNDGDVSSSNPIPATVSGVSTAANQTALNALIGEVQASPTANTVLDRLKALLTELQLKADLTETQPVSLASMPALAAGSALVGKVGIDQTTPGTTEAVTVKATGANAPVSRSTSTAYESGRLVSNAAATFYGVSGYNSKSSGQFIQIHNTSSAPADTAVPIEVLWVPAQSSFAFEAACQAGDSYSTGIYICNSSTGPTKTIGSADCWFNVRYR